MRLMKKGYGRGRPCPGPGPYDYGVEIAPKLRVLIPTAENAVGPDAFRPGDVLTARSGQTRGN